MNMDEFYGILKMEGMTESEKLERVIDFMTELPKENLVELFDDFIGKMELIKPGSFISQGVMWKGAHSAVDN